MIKIRPPPIKEVLFFSIDITMNYNSVYCQLSDLIKLFFLYKRIELGYNDARTVYASMLDEVCEKYAA